MHGPCGSPTASTAGLKILADNKDSAVAAAAAAPSTGDIPAVVDEALFMVRLASASHCTVAHAGSHLPACVQVSDAVLQTTVQDGVDFDDDDLDDLDDLDD